MTRFNWCCRAVGRDGRGMNGNADAWCNETQSFPALALFCEMRELLYSSSMLHDAADSDVCRYNSWSAVQQQMSDRRRICLVSSACGWFSLPTVAMSVAQSVHDAYFETKRLARCMAIKHQGARRCALGYVNLNMKPLLIPRHHSEDLLSHAPFRVATWVWCGSSFC